jgi:hypothetical protein
MIVSTHQPYFAPFPGFFYKAHLSDFFILLDSVQFPQGTTWITRNRFKNHQGTLWITIPVWKKGLGLQKIHQVRICQQGRWAAKHLQSLKTAYAHAPFFEEHQELLETIFGDPPDSLLDLNLRIIRHLLDFLNIDTTLVLLSSLGIKSSGTRLLRDVCRELGADRFVIQHSARQCIDPALFHKEKIRIEAIKVPSPVYPQLWGNFIPNLSALDLLFNCGPRSQDILCGQTKGSRELFSPLTFEKFKGPSPARR